MPCSAKRRYAIAVDIGGTFTDVTLVDRETGRVWQTKTPSTPRDPSDAFGTGIGCVLDMGEVAASSVEGVFHGTTVATNAILERKGATVGLVTSQGCRYVLHIGRHDVAKGASSYSWVKPARLVPPRHIVEVSGRVGPDGSIEAPLDEADVRASLRALRALDVDALAICLLHAYANPEQEEQVLALAREELPGVPVSLSSTVLPVFREYERTSATVVNAYVSPRVASYHRRLEARLAELGIDAPLRIMKSNGGMYGARAAAEQPIHTALSGPAAGVVGAALVAAAADFTDVISIDVGGTSADICLAAGGEPTLTTAGGIDGLPINVPMLDVHTIGAGGGSIARVGPGGGLTVGPESAGAEPGPVCYGRGGVEPTVTDANLVLGRSPALLGGELRLDVDPARHAVRSRVAEALGLSLDEAADGIVELLNNNMAAAIRAVSIERGHDPRRFALVAGGGGGGLHAARLAELLGIPTVIVPASAGLLSTLGLLATDLRNDLVRTCLQRAHDTDLARLDAAAAVLQARAKAWLSAEGVEPADATMRRTAGLRYANQAYEIAVGLPEGAGHANGRGPRFTQEDVVALRTAFHAAHEQRYGWSSPALPVEVVNLGISASGRLRKLVLAPHAAMPGADGRPASLRAVHFGRDHRRLDTPVFAFANLLPGQRIEGPAVIEQAFSTVLVLPGHGARIDRFGNIIMEVRR
jgi:N-methylhydantoinase A